MRRHHLAIVVACTFFGVSSGHAQDSQRGTPRQAQVMVERAIVMFDGGGAADTFAAINAGPPPFRDRDLYVFVLQTDGLVAAHAGFPDLVGQNLIDLKDANGVPLVQRMVEQATEDGVWVDYLFDDPLTGETVPKSSWVVFHEGYVFGCGVYTP